MSVSTGVPRGENNGGEDRGKGVAEHTEESEKERDGERGGCWEIEREGSWMIEREEYGAARQFSATLVFSAVCESVFYTKTLREHPTFWRIIVSLITV